MLKASKEHVSVTQNVLLLIIKVVQSCARTVPITAAEIGNAGFGKIGGTKARSEFAEMRTCARRSSAGSFVHDGGLVARSVHALGSLIRAGACQAIKAVSKHQEHQDQFRFP